MADRRYQSDGPAATDLFPNGRMLQPLNGAVDAVPALFVVPGAPRFVVTSLRDRF